MSPICKVTMAGTLVSAVATLGVYAFWIEPYLRRHLEKTGPFLLMLFAPIVDYRKARRVARRRRFIPWFLRLYEILLALTFLGLVASLVLAVIGSAGSSR